MAIYLSGIERSYGSLVALQQVDLAIAPGEVVALLGPNGAGKTTLIHILLGLIQPDNGEVLLFGSRPTQATARGLVGAMLQGGGLPSYLSVGEVIDLCRSLCPKPLTRDEVVELTDIADLVGRRANKLSGGQTQRVRFALGLVADPPLLVLDEPTTGMDVEARQGFWSAIRNCISSGRTIVFATHVLEEADIYARRLIFLNRGRIHLDGSAAEMKSFVGTRQLSFAIATPPEYSDLMALPGVREAGVVGLHVNLSCLDSDVALREILRRWPEAVDIEIRPARLEEAFRELVSLPPMSDEIV
jgi:ABC-2 type transport system ATP-binding protein